MRVLVLNSGSSSLKFRLLEVPDTGSEGTTTPRRALLSGAVKGIGKGIGKTATLEFTGEGMPITTKTQAVLGGMVKRLPTSFLPTLFFGVLAKTSAVHAACLRMQARAGVERRIARKARKIEEELKKGQERT